jgi:anthranilate synthase component 1
LPTLNAELSQYRVATIPGLVVPPLIGKHEKAKVREVKKKPSDLATGGAIGYIGYDCTLNRLEIRIIRPNNP